MSDVRFSILAVFLTALISIAAFSVIKGLEKSPTPEVLGEFEAYGTKTKVVQAGDCQMFIMNFTPETHKNNKGGHPHRPNIQFYFSCIQK